VSTREFERHGERKRSALRLYPKGSVSNLPLCTSGANLLGKKTGGRAKEKKKTKMGFKRVSKV